MLFFCFNINFKIIILKLIYINFEGDSKIGNGQLTSESLIEDDFEAELGGNQVDYQECIVESENDKKKNAIRERIDRYGIVNGNNKIF
jgi:hypothetical protein